MDIQEDFEFKPLSEGLGFHSRKKNTDSGLSSDEQKKADSGAYFLDVDLDDSTTPEPSPRSEKKSFSNTNAFAPQSTNSSASQSSGHTQKTKIVAPDAKKAVDDMLSSMKAKNSPLEKKLFTTPASTPLSQNQKQPLTMKKTSPTPMLQRQVITGLQRTEMSWTAAFLDTLLIIASCLLCLIVLLTITKIDLLSVINRTMAFEIYLATGLLISSVAFVYMTVNRVFLGQTPGEWAFDQQLGSDEEHRNPNYSVKVAFRSFLVIVTGFIILPLISFALARDVIGEWTGLQLYQRK